MNAKQFINSSICAAAERTAFARKATAWFAISFYPGPLPLEALNRRRATPSLKSVGLAYGAIFIALFLIQAVWSYTTRQFFPDRDDLTKNFLEDPENLLNFVLLCETYLVLGWVFIVDVHNTHRNLSNSGLYAALGVSRRTIERSEVRLPAALAVFLIFLAAAIGGSFYAAETQQYSSRYWFMQPAPYAHGTFGPAGFYYQFINSLLLGFVIWVALAHLAVAETGIQIVRHIRALRTSGDNSLAKHWLEEKNVRDWLEPFSNQVLLSKLVVTTFVVNLFTWKSNEPNVGPMYILGCIAAVVIGLWAVSLPRYAIQYQVFRLWQSLGKDDYKDLRGPWLLGLSATLDLLLFTYLVQALLGDAASKLMDQAFS